MEQLEFLQTSILYGGTPSREITEDILSIRESLDRWALELDIDGERAEFVLISYFKLLRKIRAKCEETSCYWDPYQRLNFTKPPANAQVHRQPGREPQPAPDQPSSPNPNPNPNPNPKAAQPKVTYGRPHPNPGPYASNCAPLPSAHHPLAGDGERNAQYQCGEPAQHQYELSPAALALSRRVSRASLPAGQSLGSSLFVFTTVEETGPERLRRARL